MGDFQRSSRFEGEDETATSAKELWGWYSYSIGAEVFAVTGVGVSLLTNYFISVIHRLTRARFIFAHHLRATGTRARFSQGESKYFMCFPC
jgi:hypothetical protein